MEGSLGNEPPITKEGPDKSGSGEVLQDRAASGTAVINYMAEDSHLSVRTRLLSQRLATQERGVPKEGHSVPSLSEESRFSLEFRSSGPSAYGHAGIGLELCPRRGLVAEATSNVTEGSFATGADSAVKGAL